MRFSIFLLLTVGDSMVRVSKLICYVFTTFHVKDHGQGHQTYRFLGSVVSGRHSKMLEMRIGSKVARVVIAL